MAVLWGNRCVNAVWTVSKLHTLTCAASLTMDLRQSNAGAMSDGFMKKTAFPLAIVGKIWYNIKKSTLA